ncbi:MAG: glutathione peroxidase [Thiobacillus sp.]|nr:glutathione peroxidase [Thiobacillus sp.]MDO9636734.1 glutathione peroxidase [Thiobacillus sp.]
MKPAFIVAALLLSASAHAAPACPPLLDHRLKDIDGTMQNLCAYAGKVVLVVNTASQCGYTGQYQGLQALHQKYGRQGLVVLGFPANDFGGQEPGSNTTIKDFCESNYAVDFALFSKVGVKAANANPLHEGLAQATGERPSWNFHKYLIDRSGTRALSFASRIEPQSRDMVQAIESLLKAQPAPLQGGR